MKRHVLGNGVVVVESMTEAIDDLKKVTPLMEAIVEKYAFAIQADAAENAPVDTGALRNSIHAEQTGKAHWEVSDGVYYGVFQELGTSRGVPALHFLGGACEKFAEKFFSEIKAALQI